MLNFIIRRLGTMVLTLVLITFIIFTITQALPGDVANMILGQFATPEKLEVLRERLGLDEPFLIRYFKWFFDVIRGDLGESLRMSGRPIEPLLLQRAKNSFFLAGFAFLIIVPTSLFLGIVAGLKEGTWLDNLISITTIAAVSLPEFVTAIFSILIFSLLLNLLPASSSIPVDVNLFQALKYLILPVITLSFVLVGYIARMVRSSVIDTLDSNYVRTAELKGLPHWYVIIKHTLRNALLPSITVIALNTGWLIGGLIVVESVFAYPGLGRLMLFAVTQRDIPLIQASVAFIGTVYLMLNFVADILYGLVNPQVKY